jgi:hypothetical protein
MYPPSRGASSHLAASPDSGFVWPSVPLAAVQNRRVGKPDALLPSPEESSAALIDRVLEGPDSGTTCLWEIDEVQRRPVTDTCLGDHSVEQPLDKRYPPR